MFQGIKNTIRQAVFKMNVLLNGENYLGNGIAEVDTMQTAIQDWYDLYQGNAPWLQHNPQSLGLPAAIASEIAKLVTIEMEVNINEVKSDKNSTEETKPQEKGDNKSSRALFMTETLKPFLKSIRNYCEYGCATGGVMFKPYFNGEGVSIECVQATDFKPVTFDNKGNITACKFVERKYIGKDIYNRLETHTLEDGILTVTNKCYKSMSNSDKGTEVPLSSVPEWADIEPEVTINNVTRPLYQYFKIPLGNTIDPNSPLGISVYGRSSTVELIKEADEQWQRFLWEFEGGELAIDASKEIFPNDKDGKPIIPAGRERLFRPNELDTSETNELIKIFSPALRDSNIGNGLNAILKRIEFNVGLAYGTLSDPQQIEKTAQEIKTSKQRSYSTVSDIQKALEEAIEGLIEAIDLTCNLYSIGGKGAFETAYKWDDSIITDVDTELGKRITLMQNGLASKIETRMWYFGETRRQAEQALKEIQGESQDDMENELAMSSNRQQIEGK